MNEAARRGREPPAQPVGLPSPPQWGEHPEVVGFIGGEADGTSTASASNSGGTGLPEKAPAPWSMMARLAKAEQLELLRPIQVRNASAFRAVSRDRVAGILSWLGLLYLAALALLIVLQFARGDSPSNLLLATFTASSGTGIGAAAARQLWSRHVSDKS